jgi:hypothetical protein
VTVTLIIFIGNINALHKGLFQRYKHIGRSAFGILPEGEQSLLDFLNITDSVHMTLSAVFLMERVAANIS